MQYLSKPLKLVPANNTNLKVIGMYLNQTLYNFLFWSLTTHHLLSPSSTHIVVKNEYQIFLYKKQLLQNSYDDKQAELEKWRITPHYWTMYWQQREKLKKWWRQCRNKSVNWRQSCPRLETLFAEARELWHATVSGDSFCASSMAFFSDKI